MIVLLSKKNVTFKILCSLKTQSRARTLLLFTFHIKYSSSNNEPQSVVGTPMPHQKQPRLLKLQNAAPIETLSHGQWVIINQAL